MTAVKAQALFIYLAVPARPHPRASLAGLLWSDVGETAAHNSLRVTLANLRQAAGDYITANRQTITLAAEAPIWLDVDYFMQACSRVQSADAGLDEGEYQALRAAVQFYQGDFLAGFYVPHAELFDEWMVAERAYYGRLALNALTKLAEIALQRGTTAAGIEDGQRALALDPLLEDGYRLLMQLYAHSGRIAHALRQYEVCVRLLDEELGIPPAAETVDLYEAIRTRKLPLPARNSGFQVSARPGSPVVVQRARHNVPHQTIPFIGRKAELDVLYELLVAPERRLITIVASGGMGKTALAREAALAQLENFADGVYFAPLAPVSSAAELEPAIADAVNYALQSDGRSAQDQLLDFLRRKQLLLVLDNFEHLQEGAGLVTAILETAAGVKILVTSRERLNLTSENILPLGGLHLPDHGTTELTDAPDAVQLFVQHARRVAPGFKLAENNWPAIAEICRLTYGMPLGIVLAAAWVSLLPPEEIAAEVAHNFEFLEADLHDLPERQRSLASVFEHTWQRLSPAEQEVFMRLAVLRNGFDRQAAQVVAGASTRLLLSLAAKALIQHNAAGRYAVHELLRQYGLRMLSRAGASDSAHQAQSRYFLHYLNTLEADLKGRRQLPALSEIEADLDNIRAAWAWALADKEHAAMDIAVEALSLFFSLRGRHHEGSQLLWRAYESLDEEIDQLLRQRILVRYCLLQLRLYDWEHDIDNALEHARTEAETRGDLAESAGCWFALGRHEQIAVCEGHRFTFDRARHYLEQSMAHYRALNDYFYMGRTAELMGDCYGYDVATMDLFQAFYTAALDYARRAGSLMDEAHILGGLGWAAIDMGQYADAERFYREAMEQLSHLHSVDTMMYVKLGLAFAHFSQGRMETARRLAENGLDTAREFNATSSESLALLILSLVATIAGDGAKALTLAEQSLRTPTVRYFRSYTDWGLAMVYYSLGHHELAWRYLRSSLQALRVASSFPRLLAVAAVLLGQQGDHAYVAEIFGAVFNDRHSAHGWMEQWRPLTDLRARLRAELGATAFQTAWDHGARLDAAALIEKLLESAPENH